MQAPANPFQFGAANDFSPDKVLEYYIADFNYSRFLHSPRNVFILGERGSGKTMTLLYHALPTQRRKAELENRACSLDKVGIYIPCNTPLMHRTEHELLGRFKASVLSEHLLVLGIAHWLVKALNDICDLLGEFDSGRMTDALADAVGTPLPAGDSFFHRVLRFTRQEMRRTQRVVNRADADGFYSEALSFATFLMPLLELLHEVDALSDSHFLLMVDDAHALNEHQIRALNSWIAYRDHSLFSLKVATVKVDRPPLLTATGGSILEGHDFTVVDMEKPVHYEQSDFGHLARQIVARRLERIGYTKGPDDFFPVHPVEQARLEDSRHRARTEALQKFPEGSQKQISDYVYKYHRAIYFRRAHKANLPVYSGFKTIVYLSTGVVRNLLEPCFWMYDKAISASTPSSTESTAPLLGVSPKIQNEVIMELSANAWETIRTGLDKVVVGCDDGDAKRVARLFEQLARLFWLRLTQPGAEPRATSFSISGQDQEPPTELAELHQLIGIARKATLLYKREGSAKDFGSRVDYYVPNRILWPIRGLDPLGQHARVELPAARLLAAARGHSTLEGAVVEQSSQGELFHE